MAALEDWLARLDQPRIELGLERVHLVREALGLAPAFPIFIVGGTNGKGSTCAILESILASAGYRVGCYTSPHILRYNERVRVDRLPLPDAAIVAGFEAVEVARGATRLTYFEHGTLAAVRSFVEAGVDAAVLEVGLGGRLDAVNAFEPDCSIVTSVALDHTAILGDTREKIGHEKAGIFRPGRPAVYGEPDVPASVAAHAQAIGARLLVSGTDFGGTADAVQWRIAAPGAQGGLPLPALRGEYQVGNAAAAIAALDELRDRLPVAVQDIRNGLVAVELPGRFQVLPGRPVTILDVAHNPHGALALATNLAAMSRPRRTWAVFSMLGDKDIGGVVDALKGEVDAWLVADLHEPRAAGVDRLVAEIASRAPWAALEQFASVEDAYRAAASRALDDDRILAFGSFHTVGRVMASRERRSVRTGE